MLAALGIGSVTSASSEEEEGHDDHEGHDHKRKRSINSIRYRRSMGDGSVTAQVIISFVTTASQDSNTVW